MIRRFFFFVMLSLLSCSENESLDGADIMSSNSPLNINVTTELVTKGELVYEPEDMGSLGLYCAFTGDNVWSDTTTFSKLKDQRYDISDDGVWTIHDGDSESWGNESEFDKYTFFAYSPHCDDTQGVTPRIENGELIIDYVVPNSSIEQPDLMFAIPHKDIYAQVNSGVSLNFYHALASVSFNVISTSGEKITAIDITGIVSDGSLAWDYVYNVPTWSLKDPTDNVFSVEIDDYNASDKSLVKLNTDRGYLMMIPQTLTSDVEVIVTIDNNKQTTLTIPNNSVWEAGAKYNYIIRLNGEDDDACYFIFDSDQISNCYIINPTKGKRSIIQIPIEDRINDFWKNYSSYGANKITKTRDPKEFTATIIWEDFDNVLSSLDYTVFDDDDETMAILLDIPADFQEGNLVFAVQEDDNNLDVTLWSWHLWFTDYNPDIIAGANLENIKANTDTTYTLSGYEGAVHRYVDGGNSTVWSGIYKDKFIMDRNIGERNEYASDYGAGSVYYQFGRKDPFPGKGAKYDGKYGLPSSRTTARITFESSVELSDDFFVPSSTSSTKNWSEDDAARNTSYIWFDENVSTSDTEGKSIFDPSPLGWRVPVSDTWSSFNETGALQAGCDNTKSYGIYNCYGCIVPSSSGATLSQTGEVSYVWSANLTDTETGLCFYYTTNYVTSPASMYVTYGFPVRAIQE